MPVCDVVVVGSYPPLPGPATAATLAAVRRAWDDGRSVRVVSYRSGAADLAVPVAGPLAGRRLQQVRRHYKGPPSVVLVLGDGAPFSDLDGPKQLVTAAGLALALASFRTATLVVAQDPGIMVPSMWALVGVTRECVVSSEGVARQLHERYKVPLSAISVEEAEAYPPLAPGVDISTTGLYDPADAKGVAVVGMPEHTFGERLRSRGRILTARLPRRLRRA